MSKLSISDKAGMITIGRFLRALGKLMLAIIIVRLLSKFEYGTYRQIILLYSLFSVVLLLGIPTSLYYFIPKYDGDKVRLFIVQSEAVLFLLGLILGLIFFATAFYWGQLFKNAEISGYLRVFALYPLFDFPAQSLAPILICYDRHRAAAIVNLIFAFTNIFSMLIPLLLGYSLYAAFWTLVIVSAIQLFFALLYIMKLIGGFSGLMELGILKGQLRYSIPLGFSSIVTILSRELDKLVISIFFLPQVFAVYTVGARELPFVTIIPYAVASTLFPKFVTMFENREKEEFFRLWHSAIRKVSLLLLPLIPFFMITATEVVTILYTKEYSGAVPVFRIYLLLLLVHITAFDSVVLSMGLPRLVLYGSVGALVLNVAANVILIKIIGFTGPAIATILVTFMITYYFMRVIRKRYEVTWQRLFPWKAYGKILITAIGSGLLIFPLTFISAHPVIKVLVIAAAFWTLYFTLCYVFRIIQKGDIDFVKRWVTLRVMSG
ncbi:MAG: oligosaccharide flippase family protein [candidate division KSB1 bacterium]|jgi:O-antigen/teichoic acid export membrane protein|nr:oligosaccharide flippase family protein [candidate division KSB1 bacterium]